MKVIRSKTIGYCSGVRNTINMAYQLLEENNVCYAIGEIVHNKEVVQDLESKGLKLIDENIENSKALIRTHGIGETKLKEYISKGIEIFDGTCPIVRRSHKIVKSVDSNTLVIIIGTKGHSEVKSLEDVYNYKNQKVSTIVISSEYEIDLIKDFDKYLVISQTTADSKLVEKLKSIIQKKFNNVEYVNTICNQPKKRIDDLKILFEKVDAIFVVGGFKSANTRLIYDYLLDNKIQAYLIENKSQITKEMMQHNVVGLTSGASTSDKIIDEIQEVLENGDQEFNRI